MLIDLYLAGKLVIVIGGGTEGTRKVKSLLGQNCKIMVVTNRLNKFLRDQAKKGKIDVVKTTLKDATRLDRFEKPYLVLAPGCDNPAPGCGPLPPSPEPQEGRTTRSPGPLRRSGNFLADAPQAQELYARPTAGRKNGGYLRRESNPDGLSPKRLWDIRVYHSATQVPLHGINRWQRPHSLPPHRAIWVARCGPK